MVEPQHPAGGARPPSRSYESWILGEVVPFIRDDCAGAAEVITCGCSLGAYHAANFALKRADVFPLAICMSGSYDPAAWDGWGERGETTYFNNPMDYVAHLEGEHLDWLRSQLSLLLVCGQGNGRTPPARWSPRAGSPGWCSPRGSGARWTSGGMTYPTIGRHGAPSSRIICHGSADDRDDRPPPDRPAARHRGGLAEARSRP